MHLELLAHIVMEPFKPFYLLSTKTPDSEIILDAVMEPQKFLDFETFDVGGNPQATAYIGQTVKIWEDEEDTTINKDWLIRAKRAKGTKEYKSLQCKFFRKDE